MLNTVTIMGRLVTDPNFKISEGEEEREVSMSWYRLAVERDYQEEGSNKRPVDYISCKAFGSNARYAQYLHKGDLLIVKGRIYSKPYTEGEERKIFTGILVEKSYLARKVSKPEANREMAPGQDITGGFVPLPDDADFPYAEVEEGFPPLP